MRRIVNYYPILSLILVLVLSACAGSQVVPESDAVNKVNAVRVQDFDDRTVVIIEGSEHPTYTVFKLSQPHRIVVDFANSSVKEAQRTISRLDEAMVSSVTTRQFGEDGNTVARVELGMPRNAEYVASLKGNRLVMQVPKYETVTRRVRSSSGRVYTRQAEVQPDTDDFFDDDFVEPFDFPDDNSEEFLLDDSVDGPEGDDDFEFQEIPQDFAEPVDEEFPAFEDEGSDPFGGEPEAASVDEEFPAFEDEGSDPFGDEPETASVDEEFPAFEDEGSDPFGDEPETASVEEEFPAFDDFEEAESDDSAEPMMAEPVEPEAVDSEESFEIIEEDEGAAMARRALESFEEAEDEGEEIMIDDLPPFEEDIPPFEEPVPAAPVETVDAPESTEPAADVAARVLDLSVKTIDGVPTLVVRADGAIGQYNVFKLEDPTRLVIDVWNVGNLFSSSSIPVNVAGIQQARIGQDEDKVRVVLDASGDRLPAYTVTKDGDHLRVKLGVGDGDEEPRVIVEKSTRPEAEPQQAAARAPREPAPQEEQVRSVKRKDERDVRTIRREEPEQQVTRSSLHEDPATKRYTGRRISLDFQNANLRDMIRLIAEVSNLNIITADDVSGTMSIRLINVPWDQALDVILESHGLGMVKAGNIVRIAPRSRLAEEERQRMQAQRDQEVMESLYVQIVPVNYANAGELAQRVQPVLSERGSVAVDSRTNVLIIKDTQRNLDDAVTLVENLDTQTPQVLIEAKIVEANTNFVRDLGIQWGGSFSGTPQEGTGTGAAFPNTLGVGGGNMGGAMEPEPGFAVNLPAAAGPGAGGAMSFLFGSLNNAAVLDLRLSALESAGQGRVISSPRITTLNNRQASIEQGVSIPFETTSAQGTQTQFIDAVIKLTVTPHITSDRSVIMAIQAEKNAPETALRSAGGAPSISKKEAQTEVLVKDGETTVIGGIFQVSKSRSTTGVPFFQSIPVLGWFFKKTTIEDQRSELLIFITPRIVQQKPADTAAKERGL